MELNGSKLLGYFLHEFGLFARILFLFGFIFFFVGMVQSVSYRNPTLVLGLTLVLFSLSSHYFSNSRPSDPGSPYKPYWDRINFVAGLVFLVATAIAAWWLFVLMHR